MKWEGKSRMTRMKRTRTAFVMWLVTVFTVYAMVVQFAAPDLVLCVGQEGHVAVEPAGNMHGTSGLESLPISSIYVQEHQRSGVQTPTCRDISLNEWSAHFSPGKQGLHLPALPHATGEYLSFPEQSILVFPVNTFFSQTPSRITMLSSTVLRI